ncbi:MAG: hypothetical protein KF886_11200 [Candidatus Hydrogenedentes bacterium]|nr:hypothetical protein [Candidatus Hydrogenedentota bacterium]
MWFAAAALGFASLGAYDFSGGPPPIGAVKWRLNEAIPLGSDRPTLVYFIHPRCPCTAAGIAQLDRVLSRFAGAFRPHVVIVLPDDVGEGWERGRNLDAAAQLPEVAVTIDRGGGVAQLFGAERSGTLLAFAPDGARLFAGGLTASRGHGGDSLGSLALHDLAVGAVPRRDATPVFGCPLLGVGGPGDGARRR